MLMHKRLSSVDEEVSLQDVDKELLNQIILSITREVGISNSEFKLTVNKNSLIIVLDIDKEKNIALEDKTKKLRKVLYETFGNYYIINNAGNTIAVVVKPNVTQEDILENLNRVSKR